MSEPLPDLKTALSDTVDIVVPVYGGLDETRRCLESLLENSQETPFEVVVVNDASPDAGLAAYVEELAAAGRVTLITNDTNAGFVDSANLGMMMHPDRDVVLLNSDTAVHGDWLDRLRGCARDNPGTGTVTPFSNNATICSYPRFLEANDIPEGWSFEALDQLFREVNGSLSTRLPTAIGFCAYITRRCIEATGYLDSLHFGRGYGEENDFSMRAAIAGFEHRLCADVFVYHSGGASFGDEAAAASEAAQGTLRSRHPQYEPLIHSYFREDPPRELRRRVDIARLAGSPRPRLLLVTHRLGGGMEKFVQDLARLLEPEVEVLIMRPTDMNSVRVDWARHGEEFHACFDWPSDYPQMVEFLKGLGVERLHYHHLVEYNDLVMRLPADLGTPYDFSIHDYYSICPLYNLISTEGRYCGEPDNEGCAVCLSGHEALAGLDINEWRGRWAGLIDGAERVIVPSNDVAERLRRYFPDANYHYLPHPEAEEAVGVGSADLGTGGSDKADVEAALGAGGHTRSPMVRGPEVKVLVLGELSVAKGVRLLEACAEDAADRELPISFRVLGWSREKLRQEPEIPLFVLGPYDDRQLQRLIDHERADAIFFPALWPETYSYTLSAAMRSGLPVAAPRLGAFTERLASYPSAMLMEWETGPAGWNDLFLSLANGGDAGQPDSSKSGQTPGEFMSPGKYLEEYLRPMRGSAVSAGTAPAADARPANTGSRPVAPAVGLTFLSSERYDCANDTAHYKYNFTLDRLTRKELLEVIAETGVGDPENLKPGQLVGWISEKDRISNERAALLVERERALADLHNIMQSRSYRAYRKLMVPVRMGRSLWRRAAPLAARVRRKHTGPPA